MIKDEVGRLSQTIMSGFAEIESRIYAAGPSQSMGAIQLQAIKFVSCFMSPCRPLVIIIRRLLS